MRIGTAIALYNGKRFLKDQIDSLLAQTRKPDVIVCCDDGSTDGTLEWLRTYAAQIGHSDRFVLVQNEKNLGYAQNFYKAIDLCDADIVFLCDQDDVWHTEKIERMCSVLEENPNLHLISCAHDIIDSDGSTLKSARYSQKSGPVELRTVAEKEVVTYFVWPGMTMALRKDFWNKIRSDAVSIDAPHDRVLGLLAASQGAMAFYDRVLCSHRLHTSNSGGEEDGLQTILRREFKIKELSTSLKWLDAQIEHGHCFSAIAQRELKGYREYVYRRLEAVRRRNVLQLVKALNCAGYINPKGLIADFVSILLNK